MPGLLDLELPVTQSKRGRLIKVGETGGLTLLAEFELTRLPFT